MSKRNATTELTHDNWNDSDEAEDMGAFRKATEDELAQRKIKKGKRRYGVENSSPSVFSALKGLSSFGSGDFSAPPSFKFLNKDTSNTNLSSSPSKFSALGKDVPTTTSSFPTIESSTYKSNIPKLVSSPSVENDSKSSAFIISQESLSVSLHDRHKVNGSGKVSKGSNKEFLGLLKSLNEGLLIWVKEHLEKNAYVNLSPVFNDYKRHFEDLRKKHPSECESDSDSDMVNVNIASPKESDKTSLQITPSMGVQNEVFPIKNEISFGSSTVDATKDLSSNQSSLSKPLSMINAGTVGSSDASSESTNSTSSFKFASTPTSSNTNKLLVSTVDTFYFGNATSKESIGSTPTFSFGLAQPNSTTSVSNTSSFMFGKADPSKEITSPPLFNFGSKSASTDISKPAFTFGDKSEKPSVFGGFGGGADCNKITFPKSTNFGSGGGSGFSFGLKENPTLGSVTNSDGNSRETEDEPPKVEVKEVKEADAFYEKKCKLFYMKDKAYVEKGVGTIYLKPAGEKTQLLVRAHTNLGNILLNIILNSSVPTTRAGKNGVIIACIPNPPIDPKDEDSKTAVNMLIRVKTSEDADSLLEKLNELKKLLI